MLERELFLENFTSIFELFATYYLLLDTSRFFDHYIGQTLWLKKENAGSILIISGIYRHWEKMNNLNIVNAAGCLLILAMIISIVANRQYHYKLSRIKTEWGFVTALLFFPIILLIPNSWLEKMQFVRWCLDNATKYENAQVLTIVIMIFCPIIIHLLTVLNLMWEKVWIVNRLRAVTTPEPLDAKSPPEIPVLRDFDRNNNGSL